MPRITAAERLEDAIATAARDAEHGRTSHEIAAELYDSNPDLIEPFLKDWAIKTLARLIGSHRIRLRNESNDQLLFESMLNFVRLPAKLTLRAGRRIDRAEATIGRLREHRRLLWKLGHPGLVQTDRMISLMEKYTKTEPRITWGEVARREAESEKKKQLRFGQ